MTASLVVDIDTSKAKASLLALRADMANQPHTLLLNVNTASLNEEIKGFIDRKKFRVTLGAENLSKIAAEIQERVSTAVHNAFSKGRDISWGAEKFRADLNSRLDGAMGNKTRALQYDRAKLITSVYDDVSKTLAAAHHVGIQSEALTAQVRLAVAAGMTGGNVHVGSVVGAAGAAHDPVMTAQLARVLASALVPAVEELSRAATAVAGAAKATRVSREAGSATASTSQSTKNLDGTTTKYSIPAPVDQVAAKMYQVKIGATATQAEANELKNLAGARQADMLRRKAEEREIADLIKATQSGQVLNESGSRGAQMARRRAEEREMADLMKATQAGQALNESGSRQTQFLRRKVEEKELGDLIKNTQAGQTLNEAGDRQRQMTRRRGEEREMADLIKATRSGQSLNEEGTRRTQMARRRAEEREMADLIKATQAGRALNETGGRAEQFRQVRSQRALRAREEADQVAAELKRGNQAAKNEEDSAFGSYRQQLANRDKARTDELNRVRQHFQSLKIAASEQYTGIGPSIVAARGTAMAFPNVAQAALGPTKSHLFDASIDVEKYRKAVEGLTPHIHGVNDAHRAMSREMTQAQQAAGRLSGSLGGVQQNIIPMIAAASALGFAIRGIFTVGKGLEYQLAFVSALSDGATVSINDFAAATRGALVGPVQAAEAMRGLAQNGLSVKESLQALPTILNLATAGEMTLTAASLGATGVMAAFNLTVADLGRVSDVFTKAAAISNTSVDEMVNAMKQASTISDIYHVSLEETAAALAILAQRNIRGTAAGTAYRNMWAELVTPTKAASESLKALGVQAFDSNHVLMESSKVLDMLHSKVATLNEESKLNVIRDVFGKKGEKAANSIFSDYEEYKRMKEKVTNESKDFSQSIVNALNQTATGKFKALFNEFELASATAFLNSSNSVKNFADSLKQLAGSAQFAKDLNTLTEAVVNLTKYVVEHGVVILATLAIWKATGWALAAVEAFRAVRVAMAATEAGAVALGIASRAALGALTGGIGLVVALGVEYFLLRDKTDAATEAQRAYNNSLAAEAQNMQASTKAIEGRIVLLQQQIKYQREGKSLTEARELTDAGAPSNKVKSVQAEIDRAAQVKSDLQAQLAAIRTTGKGKDNAFAGLGEENKLKAQIGQQDETLYRLYAARNSAAVNANAASIENEANYQGKRLEQINVFNRRVREALKEDPKLKLGQLTIGADAPQGKEEFTKFMEDRDSAFNKNARNLPKRDKQAEAAARAEDLALSHKLIASLHDEETEMQKYIKFRKDLDDAKYNPALFGPYVAAQLAEQRALTETSSLLQLQAAHVLKLQKARDSGRFFKPEDKINIDKEIQSEEAKLRAAVLNLEFQKQIAAVKSDVRAREETDKFNKTGAELSGKTKEHDIELVNTYHKKEIDPADAASLKAVTAINKEYSTSIIDQQLRVNQAVESEKILLLERAEILKNQLHYNEDEVAAKDVAISAVQREIDKQQELLAVRRLMAATEAEASGNLAKQLFKESQTAEYGWNKFWESYRNNAESSAKQVEDIMKSTTGHMTDAFSQFVTTGKFNFKSFAASVAADAAKMMANKAISQLLGLAISTIGGMFGGSATVGGSFGGTGIGGAGVSTPQAGFAKGGIMTSAGEIPLRYYAKGGIEHGPAISVHGEGSLPEANIPLQDGRTVPVTLKGNAGGGGDTNVSMSIHIDSNGQSKVESDASGKKAEQMGKLLEASTMGIIAREKRPGGLLYASA